MPWASPRPGPAGPAPTPRRRERGGAAGPDGLSPGTAREGSRSAGGDGAPFALAGGRAATSAPWGRRGKWPGREAPASLSPAPPAPQPLPGGAGSRSCPAPAASIHKSPRGAAPLPRLQGSDAPGRGTREPADGRGQLGLAAPGAGSRAERGVPVAVAVAVPALPALYE